MERIRVPEDTSTQGLIIVGLEAPRAGRGCRVGEVELSAERETCWSRSSNEREDACVGWFRRRPRNFPELPVVVAGAVPEFGSSRTEVGLEGKLKCVRETRCIPVERRGIPACGLVSLNTSIAADRGWHDHLGHRGRVRPFPPRSFAFVRERY